ncbi:MAG: hypothetical protein CR217_09195 [Beijerinckiaceae bacterium]|nr:MAG: hypothetical protein CR217_09195 [Beijerinckiaceae bacterium]
MTSSGARVPMLASGRAWTRTAVLISCREERHVPPLIVKREARRNSAGTFWSMNGIFTMPRSAASSSLQ